MKMSPFRGAALATVMLAAGPAWAQQRQAPIVFAGQGAGRAASYQTAAAEAALAGGDERSYGYGRAAPRQGAVIDIRRAPSGERPLVAPGQGTAQASAQEHPAWLERERVGPPYEANGRWYAPTPEPGYAETGIASWYGAQFHGRPTASGEVFDQEALTAAHPTLPLPSLVQVTNLENGREVIVRVNDRGPFVGERLIDLSRRTADVLGFEAQGQARVHVRYLGPAPRRVGVDAGNVAVAAAPAGPMQLTVAPAPIVAVSAAAPVEQTYSGAPLAPPPAAAPAAAATGHYFVQVGAFGDLTNAHAVRAQVAGAGPVLVDTRQSANGELFRVRVGPFASAEEAAAARRALADLGFYDTVLAAR